jgi:hypothetical protein
MSEKLKDHMKLTSLINLMKLQLRERFLRKLRYQTWRLQTTWTWRTWSLNIIRMMCLELYLGSLYIHRFEMIYCLCNSNLWYFSSCDLYCNIVSSLWYIKVVTEPPRKGVCRQDQLEQFSVKREHNQHT